MRAPEAGRGGGSGAAQKPGAVIGRFPLVRGIGWPAIGRDGRPIAFTVKQAKHAPKAWAASERPAVAQGGTAPTVP